MPTPELDPQIVLSRARQARTIGAFDITQMPPAEGRTAADSAALFFNDGLPDIADVRDASIPVVWGDMRARLYRPKTERGGAILYAHGGGWFHCNIDTHDRCMRMLASTSGFAVLGFDYSLAPEQPHPAALHDTIAAWHWLRAQAVSLDIDESRLGMAGDSAGANLVLAATILATLRPKALGLFYGCFAPKFDTQTHLVFGDGRFGLSTARMRWYWEQYVGQNLAGAPESAAPLHAALGGLPATYLALASLDPIADDTRLLAARMEEAKVPHFLKEWPGACHGFLQMTRDVALAREAITDAATFFAGAL